MSGKHTATPITVVGIGADGWTGLPRHARALVTEADVLLGGHRHLALVPDLPGQVRSPWPRPLTRDALTDLISSHEGSQIVALASGDPLVSGIGSTLIELLGERVRIVASISSVALARTRMNWPAETSEAITLVGRQPAALRRELASGRRLLVLSADEHTPGSVADLLRSSGYDDSRLTVLGDLGSDAESRHEFLARDEVPGNLPRLHVLAVEVRGVGRNTWATGLGDDEFDHDGQITKRDLRASALARLAPQPGELLWDVGAGAGSVAIEWLRAHPTCRAVAVESHADRADRIRHNSERLGVPHLEILAQAAPEALGELADPDAIFVGGGASVPGLIDHCRERLRPGGRLVVHGVTFETEQVLLAAYADHGGELVRLSVEHAAPLGGRFHGWRPARAVTQWSWNKEAR